MIYKKIGNLRACQLLLGPGKVESTVRYLGIEVDDALEISERIDLCVRLGPPAGKRTALMSSRGGEQTRCRNETLRTNT